MSLLIRLALLAATVASLWGGYLAWRESERDFGRNEIRAEWAARDRQDAELVASDKRQQNLFSNLASGKHDVVVKTVKKQLGVAYETIYSLPGRVCLDASTVRVLNATGGQSGGAATTQPASTPEAAATDQDVGIAIAECRGAYAIVSDQLNKILDIEDKRHPPSQTGSR